MEGWIKLHRKFVDWEWYRDSNTFKLFVHLLLCANHQQAKFRGFDIQPGQAVTGLHGLSRDTGLSIQSIRTSIERLKSTNEITIKSTNQFSVITITKWDTYQFVEAEGNKRKNKLSNKQLTNDQQTGNNKQECKELKNEKKKDLYGKFVELTEEEFLKLNEKYNSQCQAVIDFFNLKIESKGLANWRKDHSSDYATILYWDRNGFIKLPEPQNKDNYFYKAKP